MGKQYISGKERGIFIPEYYAVSTYLFYRACYLFLRLVNAAQCIVFWPFLQWGTLMRRVKVTRVNCQYTTCIIQKKARYGRTTENVLFTVSIFASIETEQFSSFEASRNLEFFYVLILN